MKHDTKTLTGQAAIAAYDYKNGWSSTHQPFQSHIVEDYHGIASAAAQPILEQVKAFCDENGFSYIIIPANDFQEYEISPLNFRECLSEFVRRRNIEARGEGAKANVISTDVDFAIIGPRVKTQASAKRKTATGVRTPDRIKDYLGVQLTALKSTTAKKNKRSLELLQKAMNAMEHDRRTRGIKNHYWEPHPTTGFRGHKSLWVAEASTEDPIYGGEEILAEIKIEHESQMDIDKLTRKFMTISRFAGKAQEVFANHISPQTGGRDTIRSMKEEAKAEAFNALGGILYNRAFKDAGLDSMMNPMRVRDFPSLPTSAILSATQETVKEHYPKSSQKQLLNTITAMSMFGAKQNSRRPGRKCQKGA